MGVTREADGHAATPGPEWEHRGAHKRVAFRVADRSTEHRPGRDTLRRRGPVALHRTRSLLYAFDACVLVAIWSVAVGFAVEASDEAPIAELVLVVAGPVLAGLLALHALGRRWSSFGDGDRIDVGPIVGATAVAALVAAAIAPWLGVGLQVMDAMLAGVGVIAALLASSCTARRRYRTLVQRGALVRPLVLIGSVPSARKLARCVAAHPQLGYRLEAVVGVGTEALPAGGLEGVPYCPGDDIDRVLGVVGHREVMVALDDERSSATRTIVDQLLDRGVPVRAWSAVTARGSTVRRGVLGSDRIFVLTTRRRSRWRRAVKRVFDVVVSAVLLMFVAPVVGVAAAFVRREDGGPVIFRQIRIGRDGRPFELLKLRTMNVDAEEQLIDLTFDNERTGPLFKLSDDPRRTGVGRRLERLSVDEFPQLWNVLRGDMSLVGPRPALPSEVATFDRELLRRHSVTPGITGLWQLEARDDPSFDEYRRLDLEYVERWSLLLDASIFLKTIVAVLRRAVHWPRSADTVVDLTTEAA